MDPTPIDNDKIDAADVTIDQFLEARTLVAGVTLPGTEPIAESAEPLAQGGTSARYVIEREIARGGMGAVLLATDKNVRRRIAMKVILKADRVDNDQLSRFIAEAQVTGQLEHPNIVPVHELGLDDSQNVFYTMKLIGGRTLKAILHDIAEGDKATIKEFTLNRLLTVFQKICDAMAFAHASKVIHRDLKPENIMVGDYGEVLVVDWGLAKVIGVDEDNNAVTASADLAVETVRGDESAAYDQTIQGQVMGTPAFMPPEQALGQMNTLGPAADIYSLGAILYNILALRTPVQEKTLDELLSRVSQGYLDGLTVTGAQAHKAAADISSIALPHCPNQRIPAALIAVTMKALSKETNDRYADVPSLKAEIDQYLRGFATSAEAAGMFKQAALVVRRHPWEVGIGAAALLILVGLGIIFSIDLKREQLAAEGATKEAATATTTLYESGQIHAPLLVDSAREFIIERDFKEALALLDKAEELSPDLATVPFMRARLAIMEDDLPAAQAALKTAVAHLAEDAPERPAAESMLAAASSSGTTANKATWKAWADAAKNSKDWQLLGALTLRVGDKKLIEKTVREALAAANSGAQSFDVRFEGKGTLLIELRSGNKAVIPDLTPLTGFPIHKTAVTNSKATDISPVAQPELRTLDARNSLVQDLRPLMGIPMRFIDIRKTLVNDLEPLRGMPLERLELEGNRITDLSPLGSLDQLETLIAECSGVTDISALSGLKNLKHLTLKCPELTDLTPLSGLKLETLSLHGSILIKDLRPLRGIPLEHLDISSTDVETLDGLQGMPLKTLYIRREPHSGGKKDTPLADLSALAGAPVEKLHLIGIPGMDTTLFKQLPKLKSLQVVGGEFPLRPGDLTGLPLESILFNGPGEHDASWLRGLAIPSISLYAGKFTGLEALADPSVREALVNLSIKGRSFDFAWIKKAKLQTLSLEAVKLRYPESMADIQIDHLTLGGTTNNLDLKRMADAKIQILTIIGTPISVADLADLRDWKLIGIQIKGGAKGKLSDLTPLREHTTLQKINGKPVEKYWAEQDSKKGGKK